MTSHELISQMQSEAQRILIRTVTAAVMVIFTYFSVVMLLDWIGLILLVCMYITSLVILIYVHRLKDEHPLLNMLALPAAMVICAPVLVIQLVVAIYQQYKSLNALLPLVMRKDGLELLDIADTELLDFQVKVARSGTVVRVKQQKSNLYVLHAYNTTNPSQQDTLYGTSLGEVGLLLSHYD